MTAASAFGCGPAEASRPGDGDLDLSDSGTGQPTPPETPYVNPIPVRIPYPVVTIRGGAPGAERVVLMQDGKNPVARQLGSDGSFCFDMPAQEPGNYSYSLVAFRDGLSSEEAATVEVTMDPSAPVTAEVEDLMTCLGTDPKDCVDNLELCGIKTDPEPTECDDYLEPNDSAVGVPGYEPNVYEGLMLCPNESDYYGVNLEAGDAVNVRILFSDLEGNLDLELLSPGGGEVLIAGDSIDDDESVFYRAATAGRYVVRVFGRTALDTAAYSLRISVTQ